MSDMTMNTPLICEYGTLDKSPAISATVVLSCLVSLCASLNYGYAMGYSSPTQSKIMDDLDLSKSQYSLFGSLLTIGGLIGALLCGKISDYLGRKRALWLADALTILGWVAIMVSKEAWSLDVGRLLVGLSLGFSTYVVPIYVAEVTPENFRGGFVFGHMLMLCAGISLVYVSGIMVSWRNLALIGIIPNVVQVIGLFFIPESPRWLVNKGRPEDFRVALQRLRGMNVDISREATSIMESISASEQATEVNILQLCQEKYAKSLVVGVGIVALSQLSGYPAIIYYADEIFELAGFSGRLGTIIVAVIQIPSSIVPMLLIDRCGRRPLLMISTMGLFLGSLLGAISYVFQDHQCLTKFSPTLMLISILLFTVMYAIGMGGMVDLVIAEVFPMNIKGSAGSLCFVVGWGLSWLMTFAFNFSMEWSRSGTFFILATISASTVLFVALLVPETKGQILEEITV